MDYLKKFVLKNGMELTVRSPVPEDAKNIINFVLTVDRQTRFLSREPVEFALESSVNQQKEYIIKRQLEDRSFWVIGEIDGRVVAYCDTGCIKNRLRYHHRADISCAVLRDFWRMGIGRILLNESIGWCRANGFEQLEVTAVTDNEGAIAMYKNAGFEINATNKNALKYTDGTYADEYVMRLDLLK